MHHVNVARLLETEAEVVLSRLLVSQAQNVLKAELHSWS